MKRCKLSDLLSFLKEHSLLPKRTLSQNFLVDENIVDKIIAQLALKEGDFVLEIGPGAGALTQKLTEKKIHLTCVEKDENLGRLLHFDSHQALSFQPIIQDFTKWELPKLENGNRWKVVSNLPYHITSKILKQLAKSRDLISLCVVMVEKGYADDLIKALDKHDATSFILHLTFDIQISFNVSKTCFYPMPRIDSSVLTLKPKEPLPYDEASFFRMIEVLFQHKRKTIGSTLKHRFPLVSDEDIKKLEEICSLRPEKLTALQSFSMSEVISQKLHHEKEPYEAASE